MEPVTREQLVDIVTDILAGVTTGDSWEGYLNYLIPEPDEDGKFDPNIVAEVEARYRIGNLDGQGGMMMIGVSDQPPPWMQEIDSLKAQLAQCQQELELCKQERSQSAAYAVGVEDAAGLLREERRKLIQAVKHLYRHLMQDHPAAGIPTPGDSCEEIHPIIKEYVR